MNERCLTHEIQSVICIDSRANERLSSLNFEDTHCASIAPVRLLAEAQNVRSTSDQKNQSGVFTSRLPKKSENAVVVSDASFGLKQTTYASPDTPFRSVIVVIKPSIDMRVMQRVLQPRSNASSYDIGCCVPSRRLLVTTKKGRSGRGIRGACRPARGGCAESEGAAAD